MAPHTKTLRILALGALLVSNAMARFQAEAGAAYVIGQHTEFEFGAKASSAHEETAWAPYLAGTFDAWEHVGIRLTYHYVNGLATTAEFATPPGSPLQVVTHGRYEDDVHILGAGPVFRWQVAPVLHLLLAPKLNWIASRGTVTYSMGGSHSRNDDGFTAGGSAAVAWALSDRASLTLGYEYLDLGPSFGRRAQLISGGAQWRF